MTKTIVPYRERQDHLSSGLPSHPWTAPRECPISGTLVHQLWCLMVASAFGSGGGAGTLPSGACAKIRSC